MSTCIQGQMASPQTGTLSAAKRSGAGCLSQFVAGGVAKGEEKLGVQMSFQVGGMAHLPASNHTSSLHHPEVPPPVALLPPFSPSRRVFTILLLDLQDQTLNFLFSTVQRHPNLPFQSPPTAPTLEPHLSLPLLLDTSCSFPNPNCCSQPFHPLRHPLPSSTCTHPLGSVPLPRWITLLGPPVTQCLHGSCQRILWGITLSPPYFLFPSIQNRALCPADAQHIIQ